MTDYDPPQPPRDLPDPGQPYDPYSYPGSGYTPPPTPVPRPAASIFTGLGGKLGDRLVRRAEPRFSVSLGAAGATMVLLGLVIWASSYLTDGLSQSVSASSGIDVVPGPVDTSRNYLGALLFAAAAVVGYVLVVRRRTGPLATAGAVLSAIGVPATLAFLTFDVTSGGFPINLDAVYWVSLVVWLLTYLFVPGARGRSLYVFLIAYYLYSYVLFKSVSGDIGVHISSTINGGLGTHISGFGTIAAVSLVFGFAYYAIAYLLDRTGRHGAAVGLIAPAFIATAIGVGTLEPNTSLSADGVILILVSGVLCWYGGRYGRRFTCWVWAAGIVVGVFLILRDAVPDNGTAAGIAFLVLGAIAIALAAVAKQGLREPDDFDPQAMVGSR